MNSLMENIEEKSFFAHEIKNKLAVIRANVQLIELDYIGNNKKCFKSIYDEMEKINDMLSNKTEKLKVIENTDKKLCDPISSLYGVFFKYSKLYDRDFKIDNKAENVLVEGKKELMESLFENIVKNAIEATNEGDSIKAEIKEKQNKLIISIADNGCGIDESEINKISELFYTTKKGGSGVGLFMCRRIVEQNGGKFKVYHNKPKGTKIIIELKIKK